ncbi:MAG TPA: glycosyltransferase, partial [Armatimonadota bacterium]|nr:glycosyltransferase [Armatimonadota bacterium]
MPPETPGPRSVLLITERYPPHEGGLARSSERLARHAARYGAAVHVLVTRGEGAPGSLHSTPSEGPGGGVWVHRLGSARTAADGGQHAAHALGWLHAQEGFDLLHGQYGSTSGFLAAYHARRLGISSYVSLRGNDLDRDVYDPARFPAL